MFLKILLLSHYFYPSIGGIETISEILATSFTKAGHDIRVLTWSPDSTSKVFPFVVIRTPKIKRLLKEYAWADLVFENNPCLRLSWPCFFNNRPFVVVLQTWLYDVFKPNTFSNRIKHAHLKGASEVVAISKAVRNRCWPVASVVPNCYNSSAFHIISEIDKTEDCVFVGRLVSDKGADLAIKAIRLLYEQAIQNQFERTFTLTIIGDGPDRKKLVALAADLQISHIVKFVGVLHGKELARCLNKYRYVIIPSVWKEPFGIVALESMACGCVPIVSDEGGLPEAIGKAGLTFRSGDVHSLVQNIKRISENPSLYEEMRSEAVKHLESHNAEQIAIKYLKIIDSAVSN